MSERELLNELREVVHVADDWDVSDWQRGYRACADLVTRWAGARAQDPRVTPDGSTRLDYRSLLIKYMHHVGEEEGTVFLVDSKRPPGRFTDTEWAELGAICDELPEPKPLVIP